MNSTVSFENHSIISLVREMDSVITLLEFNISNDPTDKIEEPKFASREYEMILNQSMENEEKDFSGKSLFFTNFGYAGAHLKVKDIKMKGNVSDGASIYAERNVFTENCFGCIEAKNIVTDNIGTLNNRRKEKDKMNIIAKENLIVHGKSYYAFIDAWNGKFKQLVRQSSIIIGRCGIFNDVGNGTNIEVNPYKSSFFSQITEKKNFFKKKVDLLFKEKEKVYNEAVSQKVKYERSSKVDLDTMPASLKERLEEGKYEYEKVMSNSNELESFFVNRVYETKLERIETLLRELIQKSYDKAVIFIKGKIDPFVSIAFRDKTIYLSEEKSHFKVYFKDDAIVIEDLPPEPPEEENEPDSEEPEETDESEENVD